MRDRCLALAVAVLSLYGCRAIESRLDRGGILSTLGDACLPMVGLPMSAGDAPRVPPAEPPVASPVLPPLPNVWQSNVGESSSIQPRVSRPLGSVPRYSQRESLREDDLESLRIELRRLQQTVNRQTRTENDRLSALEGALATPPSPDSETADTLDRLARRLDGLDSQLGHQHSRLDQMVIDRRRMERTNRDAIDAVTATLEAVIDHWEASVAAPANPVMTSLPVDNEQDIIGGQ